MLCGAAALAGVEYLPAAGGSVAVTSVCAAAGPRHFIFSRLMPLGSTNQGSSQLSLCGAAALAGVEYPPAAGGSVAVTSVCVGAGPRHFVLSRLMPFESANQGGSQPSLTGEMPWSGLTVSMASERQRSGNRRIPIASMTHAGTQSGGDVASEPDGGATADRSTGIVLAREAWPTNVRQIRTECVHRCVCRVLIQQAYSVSTVAARACGKP